MLFSLLLLLALSAPAQAQPRVYVYTGNNAMAKMMLDFMEVMGFIHRLPDRYAASYLSRYRGWGGFPTSSLWGLSPYTGMSSLAAPLAMSSMLSQPGMGAWPGSGGLNTMPWNSGTNSWPYGDSGVGLPSVSRPLEQGQVRMSVEELQRLLDSSRQRDGGDVAFEPKRYDDSSGFGRAVGSGSASVSVIDDLTGLWMGKSGDILTITGNRFIWTDPKGRITKGSFRLDGNTMLVQADGVAAPARYRIDRRGDQLIATNKAGFRYEFRRSRAKAR